MQDISNKVLYLLLALFLGFTISGFAQNEKIDSLKVALSNEKSAVLKLPILRNLSQSLTSIDVDQKYIYAKRMRDIAEKYKVDSIIPVAYNDMAMVHGIKTNYDSSMFYFSKSLKIAIEKKVAREEARAYVGIGYTFDRLDNPKAAIENYKNALTIFKKLKHIKGLNQAYINLGSIYFDLNEFKVADDYFRQVLKSYEEMKDQPGIAYGNFILGNSSRMLDKDDEAFKHYMKSLKIREELNDINGIALANLGLGELFLKQGKYVEAERVLKIALEGNRTLKNKYQEAVVLTTLSHYYFESHQYSKALETAKLAVQKSKEVQSKGLTINALRVLIDVEKTLGSYKNALNAQSEVLVLRDSLNLEKIKNDFIYTDFQRIRSENTSLEKNNEVISTKNLTYKRAIYIITPLLVIVLLLLVLYLRKIKQKNRINRILELQKEKITTINQELESVNEELRIQNEVTNTQKAELERINAVKNKFFSIVAHDLRSPIATLKMLFNSYFSGHLTQEEMNMLLKKLEENIFSTADFLDNLLEWSKSQLEGMVVNPEAVAINTLVERTLNILTTQMTDKGIKVSNTIDADALVWADRNMINVVFRNIISNSIKFCKQGDAIFIKSVLQEDTVLILVQDTGIGIPVDEQQKIFKLEHTISQGTSGEKGHHIGLVLCKDMVEQNHGKIWFESEVGKGTTFFIELPLTKSERSSTVL